MGWCYTTSRSAWSSSVPSGAHVTEDRDGAAVIAAVCVAAAAFTAPQDFGIGMPGAIERASLIEMSIGMAIGAITFTGSIVAFSKLQGLVSGRPLMFPGQHWLNAALGALAVVLIAIVVASGSAAVFWTLLVLSLALGFLLIMPIGGADMPVVISMLNSYSGWAACGIGFTLSNSLLIITGALVGSSGAILSYIMCKGMNRSIVNVVLGGFGTEGGTLVAAGRSADRGVRSGSAEDAAFYSEKCRFGHYRPRLWYGGRPGPARVARDGGFVEKGWG
jgi:NAD(P) transhydrogenase subunit beta